MEVGGTGEKSLMRFSVVVTVIPGWGDKLNLGWRRIAGWIREVKTGGISEHWPPANCVVSDDEHIVTLVADVAVSVQQFATVGSAVFAGRQWWSIRVLGRGMTGCQFLLLRNFWCDRVIVRSQVTVNGYQTDRSVVHGISVGCGQRGWAVVRWS